MSASIRQQTRAHLAQLRQERMRRRTSLRGGLAGPKRVAEQIDQDIEAFLCEEPAGDTVVTDPAPAALEGEAPVTEPPLDEAKELSAKSVPPSFEGVKEDDDQTVSEASEEAQELSREKESTGDASKAEESEDEPERRAGPSDQLEKVGVPSEDSPLYTLPGAGPGLVWLLETSGIHSLEDLAQADAETLTSGLGLIGQVLDVGHWISCAKTATDGPMKPAS